MARLIQPGSRTRGRCKGKGIVGRGALKTKVKPSRVPPIEAAATMESRDELLIVEAAVLVEAVMLRPPSLLLGCSLEMLRCSSCGNWV